MSFLAHLGSSARAARSRLADDQGFESVPVVIGLVLAAAAFGTALAALDWSGAATSFQTAVNNAITSVSGGGAAEPAAPPPS